MSDEYVRITCPNCARAGLKIRHRLLGQQVRCKHCGDVFTARAVDAQAPDAALGVVVVAGPSGDELARREAERLQVQLSEREAELMRVRAESAGHAEAEACRSSEVARLEEELRADRERLSAGREELDRLTAALHAAEGRSLTAERDAAAMARERDQSAGDRARLEVEVARLRAEAEEAARNALAVAGQAERDALALAAERTRADESERLAQALRAEIDARSADAAEQLDQMKHEHDAARSRWEAETAAAFAERDARAHESAQVRARLDELVGELVETRRGRDEVALRADDLALQVERGAHDLEVAQTRADEAGREALALRDKLRQVEIERQAERDGHERAAFTLRSEREDALSSAKSERARADALTEAAAGLERRLADAIDDLDAMTVRAEAAAAPGVLLAAQNGGTHVPADEEELRRQLHDARRSNQRLSALLGVFGMPPEGPARVDEPASELATRTLPSASARS